MSPPLVALDRVTKRFRPDRSLWRRLRGDPATAPRAVVDALSLDVAPGEIVGVVGANGAGKTTLLKLVAGALVPDAGTVRIEGRDAHAARHRVAVVPADERALFWRASARENVRLFATLHGLHGDARDDAVDEVLHLVGLGHTGHTLVGAFSSGMRQRVLLARALVTRAPLLVLDEPTRSLDPVTARALRDAIRDIVATRGVAVLLATHDTEEALALCDRAALLVRGRIAAADAIPALGLALRGTRVRARVAADHAARARVLLHVRPDAPLAAPRDGAVELESDLPDPAHAPLVLEALVRAGVRVLAFGPVRPTLADLIERAEAAADGEGDARRVRRADGTADPDAAHATPPAREAARA